MTLTSDNLQIRDRADVSTNLSADQWEGDVALAFTSASTLTTQVSFSSPVDLTTIKASLNFAGTGQNWTFTPSDQVNAVVTTPIVSSFFEFSIPTGPITGGTVANTVELNWRSISSFTITHDYTNQPILDDFAFTLPSNIAPVVTNVSAEGIFAQGGSITATYDYSDADSDPEVGSTFQWYRSTNAAGAGRIIIFGATSSTYTPVLADVGAFVSVEVTPSDGLSLGTPVESSPIEIIPFSVFSADNASSQSFVTSETIDNVTISISTNDNLTFTNSGLNDSEDDVFETRGEAVTVSFSSPVDVLGLNFTSTSSLLRVVADFIPGGGPNSAVNNLEYNTFVDLADTEVTLNWQHISSFTVNVEGFSVFTGNPANDDIFLDDIRFTPPTNELPVASNVSVSNSGLQVNDVLTGSYDYSDADADAEQGTTYQWIRADDQAGTNAADISGANDLTYQLATADIGKHVAFRVTPNDGIAAGAAVTSAYSLAIQADTRLPEVQSLSAENSTTALLTFNEAINTTSVTIDDFEFETLSGDVTGSVTNVEVVSDEQFRVTTTISSGEGDYRINLKANTDIVDIAGNGNGTNGHVASFQGQTTDATAPTVTLSTMASDPTIISPIPVTITFSEEVLDFAVEDLTLTNSTAQNLQTSDNTVFTVDLVPNAAGLVSVEVFAATATDAAQNANTQSNVLEIDFDIPTLTYGTTFDLSNGISVVGSPFSIKNEQSAVSGLTFSQDGTRMFIVGTVSPAVDRYNLSQAFDIGTASYGGTSQDLSILNEERTAMDVVFSPDGMKLFISGFNPSPSSLQQYNLSSAYNVHTGSPASDFSVNSQSTRPTGIAFSQDGTKMFMIGQDHVVHQYTLSSGFDLSTASYDNVNVDLGISGTSNDVGFSPDGLTMYVLSRTNAVISQYSLATAYAITTAAFVTQISGGAQETEATGFAFSPDGTRLFITGTNGDDVNQYDVGRGGFNEAAANDGSVEGSLSISIADDTFTNAGGTLTLGTNYSIVGVPVGLTPVMTVAADGKSAVLTLTGNATSNNNVDDVSDLQFTFENSAFTNATAAIVTNAISASSNLGIDFIQFPAVEIQNAPTNTNAAFTVTFQFDEDVTGFELSDIQVVNGAASDFMTVDANTYTALITPAAEGQVTIDVAASVAVNSENSGNTAALQAVTNYDTTSPIVTIQNVPANTNAAFTATFEFSEGVVGFDAGDVVLTNASISGFTTSDNVIYTAQITPTTEGEVTLDIAAGAAQDNEGNTSLLATQVTATYDTTSPTITFSGVPSNSNSSFTATVTFSEDVSGFSEEDIILSNASASSFASTDAQNYTVLITPTSEGEVTVDITASVAEDAAGNDNEAATQATSTYDTTAPTMTVSDVPSNSNSAFTATIAFSEDVSGFSEEDITLGNASASSFSSMDAQNYTVLITPTSEGEVTVDIAASVAEDAAGNGNDAATQATSTYDTTAPTVTVSDVPSNSNSAFTATVTFSEDVSGFSEEDITLNNATASSFASTDSRTYTVLITPTSEGEVTVDIAASAAEDAAGNGNDVATQATSTHDTTTPTVTVSDVPSNSNSAFTAMVTFSEDVSGFSEEDITLSNATASSFASVDSKTYTVLITPTSEGEVTVDIAASVAEDAAGNDNAAASQATSTYDTTDPTVEVSDVPSNSNSAFTATITFSEDVSGFEEGDITLSNASASSFASTNSKTYTVLITPTQEGSVTLDIAASVAQDAAGNDNAAATQATSTYDITSPTVAVSGVPSHSNSSFTATITFSEDISGFEEGDITLSNASASSFASTNSKTYTVLITPTQEGSVTLDIAASVAQDAAGNDNAAATQATSVYDTTAPTATVSGVPSNSNSAFTATITFSEDVSGFEEGDITLSNASASSFASTDSKTYTVLITPTQEGSVTVDIAASGAQDAAGNDNAAATQATSVYDTTAPTVEVSDVPSHSNSAFTATITFSEDVSGFEEEDITLSNATASSFTSTDLKSYTVLITPTSEGSVTVDIAANVAEDAAGNGNGAATQSTSIYDVTAPTVTIASASVSPVTGPYDVTITFSESVSGFVVEDIEVANGVASAFTGSGASYGTTITPSESGETTVSVGANIAIDTAGNANIASNALTIEFNPQTSKTATSVEIESISDKNLGDPAFELTANTTPTSAPVVWSVLSGSATISGTTLTLGSESGPVTVQASIVENDTLLGSSDTEVFELLDPALITPIISFQIPDTVTIIETVELIASLDAQGATNISEADITFSITSGSGQITGSMLSFTGTGAVDVTASIAATSETNSASRTETIFVNPVFTVSGLVTDPTGAAFANGDVVITDINDLTNTQSTALDATGAYTFLNLKASEYLILVNSADAAYAATYFGNTSTVLDPGASVKATAVNSDLTGINIQMQAKPAPAVDFLPPEEGGTINFQAQNGGAGGGNRFYEGRVQMGEPLPNTLVILRTSVDEYVADGLTDGGGNITFDGLPEGEYKLQVDVPGVGLVSTEVGVEEGEESVLTGVLSEEGVAFEAEEVLSSENLAASHTDIYPNPVDRDFTVSMNSHFRGEITLQLIDTRGQVLSTFQFEKTDQTHRQQLQLTGPSGIYFLRIASKGHYEIRRILKR